MRDSDLEYLKKYLDKDKLDEGIELLKNGISPQYIVGNVCFYGNIMNVNKNVLITSRAQIFLTNLHINMKIPNVIIVCPTPNNISIGPTVDRRAFEINTPSVTPTI